MKLKCVLDRTDFIPLIKTPRLWQPSETLHKGSILEVEPDIGHQLLASFPKCFEVQSYEDKKVRVKKVDEADLRKTDTAADFQVEAGV